MTDYAVIVVCAGFSGSVMAEQFGSMLVKVTFFKNVEDQLPYYLLVNQHYQRRIANCRQRLADFPDVFTNGPLAHGDTTAKVLATDERLVD